MCRVVFTVSKTAGWVRYLDVVISSLRTIIAIRSQQDTPMGLKISYSTDGVM